jgi:hypothetical protein
MSLWETTWTNVLGWIGTGVFFLVGCMAVQWFLTATDLVVQYDWHVETKNGQFLAC